MSVCIRILELKTEKKLCAVCRWESNQHKIYNAYNKARIKWDDEHSAEALVNLEKIEKALEWFNNVKDDGLVYVPYEEYKLIKDIIGYYDMAH